MVMQFTAMILPWQRACVFIYAADGHRKGSLHKQQVAPYYHSDNEGTTSRTTAAAAVLNSFELLGAGSGFAVQTAIRTPGLHRLSFVRK